MSILDVCCDEDLQPAWVNAAVERLLAQGYNVIVRFDIDGNSWQNKMYTVTKGDVTYAQDVRALYLLRI